MSRYNRGAGENCIDENYCNPRMQRYCRNSAGSFMDLPFKFFTVNKLFNFNEQL